MLPGMYALDEISAETYRGILGRAVVGEHGVGRFKPSRLGGPFMTNIGALGENTTLGTITGDIKGAVGVQILGVAPAPDGKVTSSVQQHLVIHVRFRVHPQSASSRGVCSAKVACDYGVQIPL